MQYPTEMTRIEIIDYADDPNYGKVSASHHELPDGYNLDTIEKARAWLTHPSNWLTSKLFILKWDGLIPKVSKEHGERLIAETWDDGLPWCVVIGQRDRRAKKDRGESIDESKAEESTDE
jgi:hypothetical protein